MYAFKNLWYSFYSFLGGPVCGWWSCCSHCLCRAVFTNSNRARAEEGFPGLPPHFSQQSSLGTSNHNYTHFKITLAKYSKSFDLLFLCVLFMTAISFSILVYKIYYWEYLDWNILVLDYFVNYMHSINRCLFNVFLKEFNKYCLFSNCAWLLLVCFGLWWNWTVKT